MRNIKKSAAERAETRRAQNKRAAERRRERGMVRISVEIPAAALEEAERLELTRIGVVFGEPGAAGPVVLVKREDGGMAALVYRQPLPV